MHKLGWLMIGSAALLVVAAFAPAYAQSEKVLAEWRFDASVKWNGWQPNREIHEVAFDSQSVSFQAVGADPLIVGPMFELPRATNQQWVVIDLDCSAAAEGELFYTNKTAGQYGGFESHWVTPVVITAAGRQNVTVWPFWAGMERIIHLRFDPPSGVKCRLYSIRVMEFAGPAGPPAWDFRTPGDSWRTMYAADLERTSAGLVAHAHHPQALIITLTSPFDAARHSVLRLDGRCPDEDIVSLYWATREEPGLYGEPIPLSTCKACGPLTLDLRCFPTWRGTVTHLAIGFGTTGKEALTLRSLAIEENDPNRPFLRVRYLGFDRGINRPGRPATVKAILEHASGPPLPLGKATFSGDGRIRCDTPSVPFPPIQPKGQCELNLTVAPLTPGPTIVSLKLNGQTFTRTLRIDEPIKDRTVLERPADGYDVPPPKPVKTSYQIGVYYFPGWAPDASDRWGKQTGFHQRDSLLGWYQEGRPEVADWHIKWAVENGISFFVYDWYWRSGKEQLGAGLNQGLLKARYRDQLKFAIMWANHPPFGDHTPEQLLAVTDYWIEHYFRQPNYLTVDGQPYVSFFSPHQLISNLGSNEKVRAAFEMMRKRVRDAGLPGLHIGACTGGDLASLTSMQQAGFDSVTGYNYRRTGATLLQSPYRQFLLGHEATWEAIEQAHTIPYLPLLTVGWDSRPWHGLRAERRFARRTEYFAEALARLKTHLHATGRRLAILEAWNEWGEGSYIEPNVEFGFKDLEAIRQTFAEPGNWPTNIGPDDLNLNDPYDLRRKPTLQPPQGR